MLVLLLNACVVANSKRDVFHVRIITMTTKKKLLIIICVLTKKSFGNDN